MMNRKINRYFDDGQLAMLVCILIYFILLVLLSFLMGYKEASVILNVPVMSPAFADLHVIVAGYETLTTGGNPYLINEFDPWNRLYNYPKAWLVLGYLGLDHKNLFFLGLSMGLAFFIIVFKLLGGFSWREGLYSGLLLVSPVSILAIERGNIDIIIFIVLALAILTYSEHGYIAKSRTFTLVTILSLLKLYPVFAIFIFLKEKQTVFLKLLYLLLLIFIAYFIFSWTELLHIFRNTPDAPSRGYGVTILPLHALYKSLGATHELTPYFRFIALVIGNVILLSIALFCFHRARSCKRNNNLENSTDKYFLTAFRLGVGIYIGSFAIGSNWDYRLIFLIFTVPQLFYWYSNNVELKKIVFVSLALIIILMQWGFVSYEGAMRVVIINELCAWALVGVFIYLFLISLPEWAKNKLSIL